MRRVVLIVPAVCVLAVAYLAAWPVPVSPVAWEAPPDPGHSGPFAPDSSLADFEALSLGGHDGPESVARDAAGRIYVPTRDGAILRFPADAAAGAAPVEWANTGGRPLGLAFDASGTLFVADGVRIEFADDLDVAANGKVYFSDASTKFGARAHRDEDASVLDIIEHGAHGRLLEWDPATGRATVVAAGLEFANGVAMAPVHARGLGQRSDRLCDRAARPVPGRLSGLSRRGLSLD